MFDDDYFSLFGIPVSFAVDLNALKASHKRLQAAFHPDRYVNATEQEQRMALQYAMHINEAYNCLVSPVKRARYLLSLQGVDCQSEHTTVADVSFLQQQMQWRESLDDIDTLEQMHQLQQDVAEQLLKTQETFASQYSQGDFKASVAALHKMEFITKFQQAVVEHQQSIQHPNQR